MSLSREPANRFFDPNTNEIITEILLRLTFSIRSVSDSDFYNFLSLENLATYVMGQRKLKQTNHVSVKTAFDFLMNQMVGKIHDQNYAIRNLLIHNHVQFKAKMSLFLDSISKQTLSDLRFPEIPFKNVQINYRAIQMFFSLLVKFCDAQFSKIFYANLIIKFIEVNGLASMCLHENTHQRIDAINNEQLQNLLFVNFSLKELVDGENLRSISDNRKLEEMENEIKEVYFGELALVQGFLDYKFDNNFFDQTGDSRKLLENQLSNYLQFFQNNTTTSQDNQCLNLCRLFLKSVILSETKHKLWISMRFILRKKRQL